MKKFEGTSQAENNNPQELTLQQRALVKGMLEEDKNATTDFKLENGARVHQSNVKVDDYDKLVKKFRNNPKTCLAFARDNLLAISADARLDKKTREDRVNRYLKEYFDLIIKLDRSALPPFEGIMEGVPKYVPDGFIDMGSNYNINASKRSREKILVDKKKIFEQSFAFFIDIFSMDLTKIDSSKMKNYLVLRVAEYMYQTMVEYNGRKDNPDNFIDKNGNLPLSAAFGKSFSACRHHALYAQVLMQTLGLTSRLVKCDIDFNNGMGAEPHVANLVRNNYTWYLLDVTNPNIKLKRDGTKPIATIFLERLPEINIDLNEHIYKWQLRRNDGSTFTYTTRNNMYSYIEDANKK